MTASPLTDRLDGDVAAGALHADDSQRRAATRLDALVRALDGYHPPAAKGPIGRLLFGDRPAPRGIYLVGDVGRGKSMLMDRFFALAPVANKRRMHFHEFMLDVHGRINQWRKDARSTGGEDSPLPPLGRRLAGEAWLLCLDEFQVTNIADAMILGRLFTNLFASGVVLVSTSNTQPDELYRDGLQRDSFLPFIDVLKRHTDVVSLGDGLDYRLDRLQGLPVYHCPVGVESESALEAAFASLTDSAPDRVLDLDVLGRTVSLPRFAHGVGFGRFADLCEKPLGAPDYLALARTLRTLVLSGIPVMGPDRRNEAVRFMTLVDALYDHRVKLVCSAAATPDGLHPAGDHAAAFRRTASRLIEMQAADYLHQPHRDDGPSVPAAPPPQNSQDH